MKLKLFLLFCLCICCYFLITYEKSNNKKTDTQPQMNIIKRSFNDNNYTIYIIENILTDDECNTIMHQSIPHLKRSGTISKNSVSNTRTSYNTFLKHDMFQKEKDTIAYAHSTLSILDKIDNICVNISKKPKVNQEPLQVVRYQKSQYYNPHYDCCVPIESDLCKQDYTNGGFRYSTLLIYLNDVEDGGETEFPLINFKMKPKRGCGIYFFNVTKSENTFHKLSKHAALPLQKGEKWVCNKWIRCKKYVY
jgi:prolyl 4-hydroxylase